MHPVQLPKPIARRVWPKIMALRWAIFRRAWTSEPSSRADSRRSRPPDQAPTPLTAACVQNANADAGDRASAFSMQRSLLDTQDLFGLRQRVERFLMLAFLVQLLALGAVLLHFIHLRRGELRILCERVIDLFDVLRPVECKRAARERRRRSKQSRTIFPRCPSVVATGQPRATGRGQP